MRLLINASSLTPPTYQTLVEYSNKRFKKIKKFLRKKLKTDHEIRIGVRSVNSHEYQMIVEIYVPKHIVVKVVDKDLRKLVDLAADQVQRQLDEGHKKSLDKKKRRNRLGKLVDRFTPNFFE